MKQIRITSLSLLNFKGIRELTVDLSAREVVISGRNGLGKSTIFDAFTWLLFGKDSQGRETFDYKTLGADGKPIPKLPHEVTGVLDVDGETISLTRRMTEKWVKHSGENEPKYEGNTCERLYNDVPCSESEYKSKIAAICSEDLFRQITSPAFFVSQDWKKQKAALIEMAGVTNEDVAKECPQFAGLVKILTGKTQAEYSRELAAKRKGIGKDLADIPGRISENERTIAKLTGDYKDWDSLPAQLESKSLELEAVENQIMDAAARSDAENTTRNALYEEIGALREDIARRRSEIYDEVNSSYTEALMRHRGMLNGLKLADDELRSLQRQAEALAREHEAIDKTVNGLRSQYTALRKEEAEILARSLVISESEFVCPTCGRMLECEDIEAKSAEMHSNFNEQKRRDLDAKREALKANKETGIATVAKMKEIEAKLTETKTKIEAQQATIMSIESSPDYKEPAKPAEPKEAIASDARIAELNARIEELQRQMPKSDNRSGNALMQQRSTLAAEVDAIKYRIAQKKTIDDATERNRELESRYQTLSRESTAIEKQEAQIVEFSKAKSRITKQRIDGLFRIVRFRYVEMQVNGKEKETCEAMLDGRPYRTCSTAERILMGLDIINTICEHRGISAPIVIDNAESVNTFPDTAGQRILLRVTDEPTLSVKRNDLLF